MVRRFGIPGMILVGLILAAIATLERGFARGATSRSAAAPAALQSISGKVVGVADGDTVTVLTASKEQHRIRLQGIDAPERDQAFGQRSKQHLSDLVFGKAVTVHWSKLDPYGRVVGQVVLPDGTDVNLAQLQAGLAWFFKRYERELDTQARRVYADAEASARTKKLGLWSDPTSVAPWDFRRAQRNVGF